METTERLSSQLHAMLDGHPNLIANPARRDMIRFAIEKGEAFASKCGALATLTPAHSTGRSPKDTYIVKRPESEHTIDWDSPNCIPMDPDTFQRLWVDAVAICAKKRRMFYTDRAVGADSAYALPVRTVSYRALTMLFTDNMFREVPDDLSRSCFADRDFELLVVPYDHLDGSKYKGKLRELPGGGTSTICIATDMDRRKGLVFGSAYAGSVKKLMFTVMNYLLPAEGILPLHCSANEGESGDSALLLGLSGTGKTTLSADPHRALLGDDEHGWSDTGIANFEGGCYAKLENLRRDKEPEIYRATFHHDDPLEHGTMIENCFMYPDGTFDVDDVRLTQNSRSSYPLRFLSNVKRHPVSGHPTTILFLCADANGVLPPISRLNRSSAMLWFLMGYTSKLAGTEMGVTEPRTAFSRFFGEPFMPRNPEDYAKLLGEKMERHGTDVYLVNTGWSGGPYGEGKRMDIALTRLLVDAAIGGKLKDVPYHEDKLFHVHVPDKVEGVPSELLIPRNTWKDGAAYDERARRLAGEFTAHFDKVYGDKGIDAAVAAACPGK